MSALNITKEIFQKEVLESKEPVLIDFWASWCGPCRMLSPVVDEIATSVDGVKVGKINIDDQEELARMFRIMSIPTLLVMKEGKEIKRSVGVIPKSAVLEMIH